MLELCKNTIKENKQAIVFVNSRKSAEKEAVEISSEFVYADLFDKDSKIKLNELSEQVLKTFSRPTEQCKKLARCIKEGVVFHHAGLPAKQRAIIEDGFRNRLVKIICATTTLAAGLDLPASRVIIRDLKRYTRRGMEFIPVLEYHQMAGRAGRPKYDKLGESIVILKNKDSKKEIERVYFKGLPEKIYSKLAVEPLLRTHLLSLISSGILTNRKEINEFFEKTFWAHQYGDTLELEKTIDKVLNNLEKWGFIVKLRNNEKENKDVIDEYKNEFSDATSLNYNNLGSDQNQKIMAASIGRRIAQLYLDPFSANKLIKAIKERTGVEKIDDLIALFLICNLLEIRPLFKAKKDELEDVNGVVEEYGLYNEKIYDGYLDIEDVVKTALVLKDWIEEKDEAHILEKYKVTPGEIRAKVDLSKWLFYCSHELSTLVQEKGLSRQFMKLMIRAKYGVKEELLPLLRLKEVGRVRARILYKNELKTPNDVEKNRMKVEQLFGKITSDKIFDSLGKEKVELKEDIKEWMKEEDLLEKDISKEVENPDVKEIKL